MTNVELEKKVASLENELEQSRDSVRSLAEANNNLQSTVATLTNDLAEMKSLVEGMRQVLQEVVATRDLHANKINSYD